MKKTFRILIIIISIFIFNTDIFASCDNDELNTWAEKLDIKFNEVTEAYLKEIKMTEEDVPYSYLLMLNYPRTDIVVKAKDTYSGTYNVDYDANFKNYVIGSEIHFIDKTYTFTIYMSNSAITCPGERMRTITYVVPKYNSYNDTVYCEDNPDAEICGSYTKVEETDKIDDLIEKHYNDKLEQELLKSAPWYTKLWNVIKEYALFVIIPLAIIAIFYYIVIFITKKRSEKE